MPEHDDVGLLPQDIVDPDVLGVEPVVGLIDVVRIRDRRAEDDRHLVVGEVGVEGTAGRSCRNEVERAAEPYAVGDQAGPRLIPGSELRAAAPATCGEHCNCEEADEWLHGASVYGRSRRHTPSTRLSFAAVSDTSKTDERLEQYARLTVQVGLNLQPGQTLCVEALIEHAPFARAIARQAYAVGAAYVDVLYSDQHVRRAHIQHAAEAELGFSPPWLVKRLTTLGETGGALCAITGNPEPELYADLDGTRVGKARMREVAEASLALSDGLCNWTIVAYPNAGWAETVFGEPDVERLWDAVSQAVRLDEPDPVQAWQEHIERLEARAALLNTRRFAQLRYRGPGTDLTIGLHHESAWQAALDESAGIKHVANMPTEEVYTTPDARLVEGTVRSTLPLQIQGNIVRGLEVRFEAGRAVEVRAESGEAVMREHITTDDGAARLGEVALVDGHSRVGQTGLVFYNTLFDENASSHIALGTSIVQAVPWATNLSPDERNERGVNHSSIHTDFMIGSNELEIDGVDEDGNATPILRTGDWLLV
jgi:aminopeptidase